MAEEGYSSCRVITWCPCDYLIEQILNAVACCLGLCDSFCHPRQPNHQEQGPDADANADGTNEPAAGGGDDPPTTMDATAARQRPRQPPTSEGRGGQHN